MPTVSCAIINGKPVAAADAHSIPVVNPDDGSKLVDLLETDPATVEQAVGTARQTFAEGTWSRAPIPRRSEVLGNVAESIREHAEELAGLDSLSTGLLYHSSTLKQARYGAAGWFDHFSALLRTTGEPLFRQLAETRTFVTREPAGVAALFVPWNIPLVGAALKLAAALAMGNSVVLKPSEQSPLGAARLVELIHDAGLPRGVLQLVNGRGRVTGSALAGHPDCNLVSFTGGEEAGRAIATAAAGRFAKVTMELGGKSANIIFSDADLDAAVDGAIRAVFANNGQACLAGSRILVHREVADRFIADFVARTEKLVLGHPFDEDAELGPQSSQRQIERVLAYVDIAREEGNEILAGGSRASEFDTGFFVQPTVVLASSNRARVCQEEIFGPFASILIFDDDEQAVTMANDTRYGLAAYLWTSDLNRAMGVADRLRSGYVLINTVMRRELNAPFGGFADSGMDREGGRWSLDFYSEAKTTVVPFS